MKKLILFLAIFFFAGSIIAQDIDQKDVPEAVKMTMDSLYPKMTVEKWSKRNGMYTAILKKDMKDLAVVLDNSGKLVQTENEMEIASLPILISGYVIKNYPGLKITKAWMVTMADGKMKYKTEVGEVNLFFDSMGNFMESELDMAEKEVMR